LCSACKILNSLEFNGSLAGSDHRPPQALPRHGSAPSSGSLAVTHPGAAHSKEKRTLCTKRGSAFACRRSQTPGPVMREGHGTQTAFCSATQSGRARARQPRKEGVDTKGREPLEGNYHQKHCSVFHLQSTLKPLPN